jgi:Amino acid synthesis
VHQTNRCGPNKEDARVEIRKIITTCEMILSEVWVAALRPVVPAVGMAVIVTPVAARFADDLRPLFEAGAMLGERLMRELVKLLDGQAVSYGKSAVASTARWSTAAYVHPMLGGPMRAMIGGKAVISSNVKVAGGRRGSGCTARP